MFGQWGSVCVYSFFLDLIVGNGMLLPFEIEEDQRFFQKV